MEWWHIKRSASEWYYWCRCAIGWHHWIKVYDLDTFTTCRNCARMSDQ